jgi:hypothetical protein
MLGRRLKARPAVLFVTLARLCLVVPGLVVPVFGMIFVDEVLVGGQSGWLPTLLAAMVLAAILGAALTAIQRVYLLKLVSRLGVKSASAFLWHALRLDGFYAARSPGIWRHRVRANDAVVLPLSGRASHRVLDLFLVVFYAAFALHRPVADVLTGSPVAAHPACCARERMRTDLSRSASTPESGGVASGGLQMIETIGGKRPGIGVLQPVGGLSGCSSPQAAEARAARPAAGDGDGAAGRFNRCSCSSRSPARDGRPPEPGHAGRLQGLMCFVHPVETLSQVGAGACSSSGEPGASDDVLGHGTTKSRGPGRRRRGWRLTGALLGAS